MYAMTDRSTTTESDTFFKSIEWDWYESTDGEVEASTGWFGLLRIDDAFRYHWAQVVVGGGTYPGRDPMPESIEDGLYLVTIDNNGLVWANQAPVEDATRANYQELIQQYADWLTSDEDDESNVPDCDNPGPSCTEHYGRCD